MTTIGAPGCKVKAFCGKRLVFEDGIRPGCLITVNGRIDDVLPTLPQGFAGPVTNTGELTVMAGLVDTHVHVNEPGRTDWEGFENATRAAAAGGITTLVDMPLNCLPVTTTAAALQAKLDAIQGKMWIDCGFWGGVVPGSIDALPDLLAAGVLGVKSFLIDSGIPEFPPMAEKDLHRAMPVLAAAGVPYLIHAELDDESAPPSAITREYRSFLQSRPRLWENRAVALMTALCRQYRTKVHIVHLSSADCLPLLREARREGLPLTAETCPHYLLLEAESIPDGKTLFKCCPPIRERENQQRLWQALSQGDLDFIVSDHSPCTPVLKEIESGDLEKAWGGIASLQLGLPLVWTAASQRGFDLPWLSRMMSLNTARFAGLGARKGRLAKGCDADLVVWDPAAAGRITAETLCHRHKVTPYMGRTVKGVIHQTYLRGQKIFDRGQFANLAAGRPLLKERCS